MKYLYKIFNYSKLMKSYFKCNGNTGKILKISFRTSASSTKSSNIEKAILIDKNVYNDLEFEKYKHRDHPGVNKIACVELPFQLRKAMDVHLKDDSKQEIFEDAKSMYNFLRCRHADMDSDEKRDREDLIKRKLIDRGKLPTLSENPSTKIEELPKEEQKKFNKAIKSEIYNWKRMEYNEHTGLVYMLARMAPDFASLKKIFNEILQRDPSFKPKALFDFGSGIGSVTWAMESVWPSVCQEAYYVDCCKPMLELSEKIIKDAFPEEGAQFGPKNTFYRQFLPASSTLTYDLVVSSRTFFEVGNISMRARTADILWKKVAHGGYLVLVENSSLEGHRILMEVRDFIFEMNALKQSKYDKKESLQLFSPCPHEKFCPRIYHKSEKPCYFFVNYMPYNSTKIENEYYSYVVLKKGDKIETDPNWPRIIQPVIAKNRMAICRLCTSSGELIEKTITKGKNRRNCYLTAKNSQWGDRLPVSNIEQTLKRNSEDLANENIIDKKS